MTMIDDDIASSLHLYGPTSRMQGVSNIRRYRQLLSLDISGADPNAIRYQMQGVRNMRNLNLTMQSMDFCGLPVSENRTVQQSPGRRQTGADGHIRRPNCCKDPAGLSRIWPTIDATRTRTTLLRLEC